MKTTYFSPRLYADGVRQLRLMGILFTAIIGFSVVSEPLATYTMMLDTSFFEVQHLNYYEMNPSIILSFCLVAPLLTLNLFSFLNQRESSDFYHALPTTRTCLFFSFFAAVMTWVLIFIGATTVLSVGCHALFPQLYAINYSSVLLTCFNCLTGSLLIAASVAIAMSITGTAATNVLISLLLIFLPRLLLVLMLSAVADAFPLVAGLDFLPLLSTHYNVPTGFVMGVFSESPLAAITDWKSGVYTLVLGLLYTVFAVLLFNRRKSESASHAAPNRYFQGLYRFLVGFSISFIVTLSLWSDIRYGYTAPSDLIGWIILYAFAIIAMLVYELLCTRRFKGLLRRSAVTVLLLVAANAVVLGLVVGVQNLLQSYAPSAKEITSVRIISVNDEYSYGETDYFADKTKDVRLTDPAILEMVSQRLGDSLELLEKSEHKYYAEQVGNSSLVVSIKSGGVSHLRRIIVYDEDIALLSSSLTENRDFQDIYLDLPDNYVSISDDVATSFYLSNDKNGDALYSALQSEVKELGFETWYTLLNVREVYDTAPLITLHVSVPSGFDWTSFRVPLYPSLLPKTCAAYIDLCNGEFSERRDALPLSDLTQYDYLECRIFNYSPEDATTRYWDQVDLTLHPDEFTWVKQLSADAPIDPTAPLCYLRGERAIEREDEYGSYYDYVSYEGWYALPDGIVIPTEIDTESK